MAVTVNVRSTCSPGGGTGARSCAGVARSTPGGTHSSTDRNTNPICCSGSCPTRRTRRSRLPPRLSTTTCSSATGLSSVRSALGSNRSRTGTSTGAADVSWISRTTAGSCRPVVDRPHGEGALGAFPGGGRRRHDPHLDGGTTVGWRPRPPRGRTRSARPPRRRSRTNVTRRGWLAPRLSRCTVNRPRSASFTRTTAGSVRIRAGPPIRGTTSAISTSVCTRSSLSGRTRTRRRTRWATTGVSGRTSKPDPHRRAVPGQQPDLRHGHRQPGRRPLELDAVPLDDRRGVPDPQLDASAAGGLEHDVAVGHRHLRWARRVLPRLRPLPGPRAPVRAHRSSGRPARGHPPLDDRGRRGSADAACRGGGP